MYTRTLALVAAAVLVASSAQALPTIALKWRTSGTATVASPAASSVQIADIVITTVSQTVNGIFVSIEFDQVELQATGAKELAAVSLPGMGNEFSPIFVGTTISNTVGLVTLFDEATLATGLAGGNVRTLGSVTFHVVGAANDATDIDVIASVQNTGIDAITSPPDVVIGANFVGASVTGPTPPPVPEPTTALLLIAGVAGLSYVGRRSRS